MRRKRKEEGEESEKWEEMACTIQFEKCRKKRLGKKIMVGN
jgi:hypothetical protein